jgi:tetratricopeptide (TPR) repeat protein
MDAGKSQLLPNRAPASGPESLGSWKEIAAYLRRDERTVRRWEKEGLPVHRHMHNKRASVYAFRSEIDGWWQRDHRRLEQTENTEGHRDRRIVLWIAAALVALPVAVLALNIAGVQERLFGRTASTARDREAAAEQQANIHPAAREAYLLGRAYFLKTPSLGAAKAKEYYEKAIATDPNYAAPYAGLAELYAMVGWRFAKDPRSGYEDVRLATRQFAEKALALDEGRAEAHAALAWHAQQQYDWQAAEQGYRRAIELNPRYGLGRLWYAMYLYGMERFEEAALQARRAQELEPASAMVQTWAGRAYFFNGRLDDAMRAWQLALELDPKYAHCYLAIVGSYIARGMSDRVIATLKKGLADIPNEAHLVGALAQAYAAIGERAEAHELLRKLQLRESSGEVLPEFPLIWAHAAMGNSDEAFARLEKAYREHRDRMMWVKVDPQLATLRADPRFHDLLRRMNMTPMTMATSPRQERQQRN